MNLQVALRKYGRKFWKVIFFFTLTTTLYVSGERLFQITTIEVIGQDVDLMVEPGKVEKNLLFFHTENLKEQLLEENPLLQDVQITKTFPSTLTIAPVLRVPIARLSLGDREILVDRDGVITGYLVFENDLPILEFPVSTTKPGQRLRQKQALTALQFIEEAGDVFAIKSATKLDNQSVDVTIENMNIYFTQDSNVRKIIATLQTIVAGFRIRGTLPTVIDLRFTKPVVKF